MISHENKIYHIPNPSPPLYASNQYLKRKIRFETTEQLGQNRLTYYDITLFEPHQTRGFTCMSQHLFEI